MDYDNDGMYDENVCIHMYVYIRFYVYTNIRSYIHTYMHTYSRTTDGDYDNDGMYDDNNENDHNHHHESGRYKQPQRHHRGDGDAEDLQDGYTNANNSSKGTANRAHIKMRDQAGQKRRDFDSELDRDGKNRMFSDQYNDENYDFEDARVKNKHGRGGYGQASSAHDSESRNLGADEDSYMDEDEGSHYTAGRRNSKGTLESTPPDYNSSGNKYKHGAGAVKGNGGGKRMSSDGNNSAGGFAKKARTELPANVAAVLDMFRKDSQKGGRQDTRRVFSRDPRDDRQV